MDVDSDETVDSDELEDFIYSQKKNESKLSKVSKSKTGVKSSKPHSLNVMSDSDSSDIVVKKVQKIHDVNPSCVNISKDSDTDRTVDSDELEELAQSRNKQKSSSKIALKKVTHTKYKDISDIVEEEVKKTNISKTISHKKPQSRYKEISDSDSDDKIAQKTKISETISRKKPQSRYKEILDSDDNIVKKEKISENISSKKFQSSYKEVSNLNSSDIMKTKKVDKSVSSKKLEKCKYGKKCYRKNPDHIKNFSHGSDTDESEGDKVIRQNKNMEINSTSISKRTMCDTAKETNLKTKSNIKASYLEGDGIKGLPKEKAKSSKGKSSPLKNQASMSPGCKNYQFYLTKVNGIPQKYNCLAYDIKDLLSSKDGTLISSAQFNYVFDIPWMMQQYPEKYRKCPLTLVHGEQRQAKKALEVASAAFPNIKLCQARLDIPYGTHHTKMMFLLYKEGFKIVIHTSNIIDSDWDQRTQGMWISPVLPELKNPSATEGESPTNFKADLLEYVTAYGAPGLDEWLQVIKKHDFSAVSVVLIGSVPGRHVGSKKISFGHLKLRKILNLHGCTKDTVSATWPIVCQFSSIGSLGSSPNQWLKSEFGTSLSTLKDVSLSCQSSNLKLVYPTEENVRKSLQGYPAGASLPYSYKVAQKQTYLKDFMYQWKSDKLGRSEASPHIKTYLRVSPDNCNIAWFLLTSANLSKAAWGALEKKDTQLMIRSYELGVLFLPKFYGLDMFSTPFSIKTDFRSMFPVPYDIPLEPYTANDQPWIWDIPHIRAPDRFGNMWCPP